MGLEASVFSLSCEGYRSPFESFQESFFWCDGCTWNFSTRPGIQDLGGQSLVGLVMFSLGCWGWVKQASAGALRNILGIVQDFYPEMIHQAWQLIFLLLTRKPAFFLLMWVKKAEMSYASPPRQTE